MRFDKAALLALIADHGIGGVDTSRLPDRVTRDTRVECACGHCGSPASLTFRSLHKYGARCVPCTRSQMQASREATMLERHGHRTPAQVKEIAKRATDKARATHKEKGDVLVYDAELLARYVANPIGDIDVTALTRNTKIPFDCGQCGAPGTNTFRMIVRSEAALCLECRERVRQDNRINTCLRVYGVPQVMQAPFVIAKLQQTNQDKYGAPCSLAHPGVREKARATCVERFGTEWATQSDAVKARTIATNLRRRGVKHVMQDPGVMERSRATSMKRYGVRHPAQHPDIAMNMSASSYKRKAVLLDDGSVVYVQGYEDRALIHMTRGLGIPPASIVHKRRDAPKIWWTDGDGKQHRHFCDFFIPSMGLCIEVKSKWTLTQCEAKVIACRAAAEAMALKYQVWVFDQRGETPTIM